MCLNTYAEFPTQRFGELVANSCESVHFCMIAHTPVMYYIKGGSCLLFSTNQFCTIHII